MKWMGWRGVEDQAAGHQLAQRARLPEVGSQATVLGIQRPLCLDAVGVDLGCLGRVRCDALVEWVVRMGWRAQARCRSIQGRCGTMPQYAGT